MQNLWIVFIAQPVSVIGFFVVVLCIASTKVERDDAGHLTRGGKNLIWARSCLVLNWWSYMVIVLTFLARGPKEIGTDFWNPHEVEFIVLHFSGTAFAVLAVFLGFRAKGGGVMVLRIASLVLAAVSIFAAYFFPYAE